MTENQPEGSETRTNTAMEEDLIKENAFEVEETDQYTQRASAKSFPNVKRKAPASQSKSNKKAKKFFFLSTKRVEDLLIF